MQHSWNGERKRERDATKGDDCRDAGVQGGPCGGGGGGDGGGGGGEVVMTTAATNHPEVTQREITLHPIRFKAGTGPAIPRRKSPP